jgi:hypothetical protein
MPPACCSIADCPRRAFRSYQSPHRTDRREPVSTMSHASLAASGKTMSAAMQLGTAGKQVR